MLTALIIGGGNIAGGFDAVDGAPVRLPRTHAGAYAAHAGYRVQACVEPDATRRAAFMSRWRVQHGYARLQDALEDGQRCDVISICSPTAAHHEDAVLALKLKPRLLFCEKPLSTSLELARDLNARCGDAGVLLAVNHNRRWDADLIELRDALAAGRWGTVRSVSCQYNKGILNNGSHMIDLLNMLLGPLALVYAGEPVYDCWDDDPSIPATMVTQAGVPVSMLCGHAVDYSIFEFQVVTSKGVVSMEDGGLRWRERIVQPSAQFQGYRVLPQGEFREGRYLACMSAAVANIHDALVNGAPLASTGETALEAQQLCAQIRRSAGMSPPQRTPS